MFYFILLLFICFCWPADQLQDSEIKKEEGRERERKRWRYHWCRMRGREEHVPALRQSSMAAYLLTGHKTSKLLRARARSTRRRNWQTRPLQSLIYFLHWAFVSCVSAALLAAAAGQQRKKWKWKWIKNPPRAFILLLFLCVKLLDGNRTDGDEEELLLGNLIKSIKSTVTNHKWNFRWFTYVFQRRGLVRCSFRFFFFFVLLYQVSFIGGSTVRHLVKKKNALPPTTANVLSNFRDKKMFWKIRRIPAMQMESLIGHLIADMNGNRHFRPSIDPKKYVF